jgi:ubiquitin-protein ligase E3 A
MHATFNELMNLPLTSPSLFKVVVPHNVFEIRRDHLLEDAQSALLSNSAHLKKPLRVKFVDEDGLDQGGVQKEFLQLAVYGLLDLESSPGKEMWVENKETRTVWFKLLSRFDEVAYEFVGRIIGLAIYNGVILDLHFPFLFYKKILGWKCDFNDFIAFDPVPIPLRVNVT